MNRLLKYPSYLFHPIWMPFVGTFIYFLKVPRFFPEEVIKAKLMAVAIMTLFIPIVFFFMLRTLNQARGIFLESVEERKWPLLFYCVIQLVILQYIVNRFDFKNKMLCSAEMGNTSVIEPQFGISPNCTASNKLTTLDY